MEYPPHAFRVHGFACPVGMRRAALSAIVSIAAGARLNAVASLFFIITNSIYGRYEKNQYSMRVLFFDNLNVLFTKTCWYCYQWNLTEENIILSESRLCVDNCHKLVWIVANWNAVKYFFKLCVSRASARTQTEQFFILSCPRLDLGVRGRADTASQLLANINKMLPKRHWKPQFVGLFHECVLFGPFLPSSITLNVAGEATFNR